VRGATVWAAIPSRADGKRTSTGGLPAREVVPLAGLGLPALQASESRPFV
jgi:hypothetical protein